MAAARAQACDLTIGLDRVDFEREAIDAALRFGGPDWPGLNAELLFLEDVFPVCSPRLLRGRQRLDSTQALRHHTLLHTRHRHDDWHRWLAAAKIPPTVVDPGKGPIFELTTMAIDAARAGSGVAITREAQVRDALRSGSLVAPFRRDLLRGEGCYFLTPPRREAHPDVTGFREWLKEEAAQESVRSDYTERA